MAEQESLTTGDVVEHCIHGKKEVVIGIARNRFLCTYLGNIQSDGKLRRGSRVSIHPQENLRKIGHLDKITPISLLRLYGNETRRLRKIHRRNLQREIACCVLAAVMAYFVLSGIEGIRSGLEGYFLARVMGEVMEMEMREEERREETEKQQKGHGEQTEEQQRGKGAQKVMEKMQKRFGLNDKKIEELQNRYLKEKISKEELTRLAKKYLEGGMDQSEKKMLKERYLKPGVTKEEIQNIRNQFVGQ